MIMPKVLYARCRVNTVNIQIRQQDKSMLGIITIRLYMEEFCLTQKAHDSSNILI